ncbi:MAG: hypothetical protein M3P93_05020, partial [Actinomycetota bacterium]|nr:hypothetical protein [Actinomycetota bacterium]
MARRGALPDGPVLRLAGLVAAYLVVVGGLLAAVVWEQLVPAQRRAVADALAASAPALVLGALV